MPLHNLAYQGERREHRHEVHFRTRARDAGNDEHWVVVVNLSPNGLMARCDSALAPGARLTLPLPGLAPMAAEVRWALGGRIGCEFAASIAPDHYTQLMASLTAPPR